MKKEHDMDIDDLEDCKIVLLTQFETLAKEYNVDPYESIEDILSTMKELNNILNNK